MRTIERIDAPLFVLHGENDPRVPVGEAEQVAARVGKQDVPVETLLFDGEGHGIVKRDNRIEAYPRSPNSSTNTSEHVREPRMKSRKTA